MTDDFAKVIDGLRDKDLLPETYESVFVSGSLVRGWGNSTSDVDVIVISKEAWPHRAGEVTHVALEPPTLQHESTFVDGRRWDVEYWTDAQFEQLLDKMSLARFERGEGIWQTLSIDEMTMLERLPYAIASGDTGWLDRRKEDLRNSAHRAVLVTQSLDKAGSYTEDAAGQLEAGDLESAVLTAKLAFDCAVDGLLASAGQFGSRWPKWRARRFRATNQSVLTFDEFWAVQTMRVFDPDEPAKWVEEVILLCRKISMEVDV
jgi:predicted nucleotidyltransferase